MILDTLPKKSTLAILIAYTSVVWLKAWHEYGFSRSPIQFPPVSNWWRDSLIMLMPVSIGVWISLMLAQWLIQRSNGRLSASTQSILAAVILAALTSLMIVLTESSRFIYSGIGNEFIFLASICSRLYPKGNWVLNILKWMFPGTRALRLHILLQDGFNLALANLTITIILILILEWVSRISIFVVGEQQQNEAVSVLRGDFGPSR